MKHGLVGSHSFRDARLAAPRCRLPPGAVANARCQRCRGRRTGRMHICAEVHWLARRRRRLCVVPGHRAPRVLRLVQAQSTGEITPDDGTAIDMAAEPSAVDPEQALLRDAEEKALADAVAALPLPYREVLILREMRVRLKRTRSSCRRWPPSSDIRRLRECRVTYAPAISSRGAG